MSGFPEQLARRGSVLLKGRGRRPPRRIGLKGKLARAFLPDAVPFAAGVLTLCAVVFVLPDFLPGEADDTLLLDAVRARAAARGGLLLSEQLRHCPSSRSGSPITYAFLHLHKTSGNHVKEALFGFAKRNALRLFHTCHRARGDGPLERAWFNRGKAAGAGTDCNLDGFAALPVTVRERFDFVVGHMHVGLHRLLPAREVRYFTFVRHPLNRKVSHFMHFEVARYSSHASKLAEFAPQLEEYLVHRNRNYMTMRLSTTRITSEVWADVRYKMIHSFERLRRLAARQAGENLLNRFFFVGVYERYEESACVLSTVLNEACYGAHGSNAIHGKLMTMRQMMKPGGLVQNLTSSIVHSLSPHVREQALRTEALDLAVYGLAEAMLEEQLMRYPHCRR